MYIHVYKHIQRTQCALHKCTQVWGNKHVWRPDAPVSWFPHSRFTLVFETGSLSGPSASWFSQTLSRNLQGSSNLFSHLAGLLCGYRRLNWHLIVMKQVLGQLSQQAYICSFKAGKEPIVYQFFWQHQLIKHTSLKLPITKDYLKAGMTRFGSFCLRSQHLRYRGRQIPVSSRPDWIP